MYAGLQAEQAWSAQPLPAAINPRARAAAPAARRSQAYPRAHSVTWNRWKGALKRATTNYPRFCSSNSKRASPIRSMGADLTAVTDSLDLDLLGLMWDATDVSAMPARPATPLAAAEAQCMGMSIQRQASNKSPEKKRPQNSGSEGASADDSGSEGADAKRQKRMQRNRESAAMSRERKKRRIDELEHTLATLASTVARLQAENEALRSQGAGAQGTQGVQGALGVSAPLHALKDVKPMADPSPASFVGSDADAVSLILLAQDSDLAGGISLPTSPAALFGAAGGDDTMPALLLDSYEVVGPTSCAAYVACAG